MQRRNYVLRAHKIWLGVLSLSLPFIVKVPYKLDFEKMMQVSRIGLHFHTLFRCNDYHVHEYASEASSYSHVVSQII